MVPLINSVQSKAVGGTQCRNSKLLYISKNMALQIQAFASSVKEQSRDFAYTPTTKSKMAYYACELLLAYILQQISDSCLCRLAITSINF